MKLLRRVTGWASVLLLASALLTAAGPGDWEQPAGALAEQIAAVLGPGQAMLGIRNLSSIANGDLPAIRALLERDLKGRGVSIASGESANGIRVTLCQNDRERLWIAEITEGNQNRVVMVTAGPNRAQAQAVADYMTLRRERLPILGGPSSVPIMAALESGSSLIVLRPEVIDLSVFGGGG